MTTSRGKLIALEGIDGAGTTTQGTLLVQHLNGTSISEVGVIGEAESQDSTCI